jgi:hypothetical protein
MDKKRFKFRLSPGIFLGSPIDYQENRLEANLLQNLSDTSDATIGYSSFAVGVCIILTRIYRRMNRLSKAAIKQAVPTSGKTRPYS